MRSFSIAHRLLALVLAFLIGLPLPLWAQSDRLQLPDLGATAGSIIPLQVERAYARSLIHQMREAGVLIEDPQISAFFSDMGFRLASHSDDASRRYYFVVLDQPNINAFAAPGGVIALHSGLILEADNESEVAGVLGHEIAHITQQHTARAFEAARNLSIPLLLTMLGLILASGGSGEAAQAAVIGTQAASIQSQINFTRQNEYEADRIGIGILAASGYDPSGMAGFFGKLGRVSRGLASRVPEYQRTHPITTTRIAEAKNRAANLPPSDFVESIDFFLIQARLRALLDDKPEEAMHMFKSSMERDKGPFPEANEYGMSIALARTGELDKAEAIIDRLMANDPRRLIYQLQKADIDMQQGDTPAALQRLEHLNYQFPGNTAVTLHYSDALLTTDDTQNALIASDLLKQYLVNVGGHPQIYEQFARAYDQAGDEIRASEAIAEAYYLKGAIGSAIYQLEKLSKRDDLDYYQRARISSRLSQMKVELAQYQRQQS